MNIENAVDTLATVENAGGQYSLVFPYTSCIGKDTEKLSVHVPIRHEQPSPNDKKALLDAVIIQGGLGKWVQKDDQSVWLMPADGA